MREIVKHFCIAMKQFFSWDVAVMTFMLIVFIVSDASDPEFYARIAQSEDWSVGEIYATLGGFCACWSIFLVLRTVRMILNAFTETASSKEVPGDE